jgi:ferredoxin/truncated hemoglobin YjbI
MSARIRLGEAEVEVRDGESVLDAFLRSAVPIPFSCRGGVCHVCMLRCTQGEVPPRAQSGLDASMRDKGYLLACQCHPHGPMVLEPPRAADRTTVCALHDTAAAGPFLHLRFESARAAEWQPGQRLRIVGQGSAGQAEEPLVELTRVEPGTFLFEALLRIPAQGELPRWLREGELGHEFTVAGPLQEDAAAGVQAELAAPAPDPALWQELEDGLRVRAVLEDFYGKVYSDDRLAPFFRGVTLSRSIDKQYSFLRQLMTGERVYFGDRPRNAHHWMVISGALFDYRQSLMEATQARHGLTSAQIARWTRLETHYRADIVKDAAWPRRVHGIDQPLDGYALETLSEATVCDHCGSEVAAGMTVRYHLRIGHVSCGGCAGMPA